MLSFMRSFWNQLENRLFALEMSRIVELKHLAPTHTHRYIYDFIFPVRQDFFIFYIILKSARKPPLRL